MQKFPELKPEQLEYFRNVFYNSKIFTKQIDALRKKYGINLKKIKITKENSKKENNPMYSDTIQFFRATKEVIDLKEDNQEEKELWNSFESDLLKISEYFGLGKYYKYLKNYVLFRGFEPLDFQKIMHINDDKINLELPFQITKEEFNKIWRDIQSAQKSSFAKNATQGSKIKERFKKGNFDNKLYFYRNKYFHEPLPENLSKLSVDESNKLNRISEIDKLRKSL
ncbi:MAG: hypothetical protein AB7E37_00590 [Candidatus Altimarinota bacterium]